MASPSPARPSQAYAPLWLKVLVIVMGLLIVAGFVVIAAEIARRMSSASPSKSPAGMSFAERIPLPPGGQVVSINTVGERLVVHVSVSGGSSLAYLVDPRTGALLGTIEFPPGAAR